MEVKELKNVDLHLHTVASDGSYTPQELVDKAVEKGFKTIALTDHDTIAGIEAALARAKELDLEVIPGIELTTYIGSKEVHIIGYYIDYLDQELRDKLTELEEARRNRGKRIVEKLNKLGVTLEWEQVKEVVGDSVVGRPHIARALVDEGYIADISEAFEKYIGDDGPAYVAKTQLTPREAIEIIDQAGGVSILAHPGLLEDNELVMQVIEAGIEGLEVYYSKHNSNTTNKYAKLAKRYEILITGGSDCHGPDNKDEVLLGQVKAPQWVVADLKNKYREKNDI